MLSRRTLVGHLTTQLLHLQLELDQAAHDELELPPFDAGALTHHGADVHRQKPRAPALPNLRGMSSGPISRPGASTTMLSTRFRSSRTFPGHGYSTRISQRLGRDALERPVVLSRQLRDELPDEDRDVLAPLAQRRQVDAQDVEPVVQVRPEAALLDALAERIVRRRDDADVDRDGLRCRRRA